MSSITIVEAKPIDGTGASFPQLVGQMAAAAQIAENNKKEAEDKENKTDNVVFGVITDGRVFRVHILKNGVFYKTDLDKILSFTSAPHEIFCILRYFVSKRIPPFFSLEPYKKD